MAKIENRVALYCRVSTSDQNPAMQVRELRQYCKRRGWVIQDEYLDKGISGAKENRPELDRLMADAHKRRFDVVCVWRFDRFARSVVHLLRALETFKTLGIDFVSYSEQIDTTTPAGKLVFTVLGAVGEIERSLTGERVKAGMRNAKAKGKRLGRPPLKELSAEQVQQLRRDRRRRRMTFSLLAKRYGVSVWSAFQICKRGHLKGIRSK